MVLSFCFWTCYVYGYISVCALWSLLFTQGKIVTRSKSRTHVHDSFLFHCFFSHWPQRKTIFATYICFLRISIRILNFKKVKVMERKTSLLYLVLYHSWTYRLSSLSNSPQTLDFHWSHAWRWIASLILHHEKIWPAMVLQSSQPWHIKENSNLC